MKLHKWVFIGIVIAMVLLNSCTSAFINEISRSEDFYLNNANPETAIVIGTEDVVLNDFVKTFYRKYSDYHKFAADYVNQFTVSLKNANVLARVEADTSFRWGPEIYYSYFANDKKTSDSIVIRQGADYLIRISGFEVSNHVQTNLIPGGSNNPPMYNTVEYCIVQSHFQVIDVKTHQTLLEFISTGKRSVVFFTYEAAFNIAFNSSIERAIEFLKTGKREFHKQD